MSQSHLKLNNGIEMPALGLGVVEVIFDRNPQEQIQIEVSDTGSGISTEDQRPRVELPTNRRVVTNDDGLREDKRDQPNCDNDLDHDEDSGVLKD